jgi:hypothetical protein
MPVPFASALAMPLLTSGGGAAAGAGGFGSLLAGGGSFLTGAASIGSLFGGGGRSQVDFNSLYAPQLAPGQTGLNIAGQELGALMAPYVSFQLAQGQLGAQTSYDQFDQATKRDTTQGALQAGIASQYANLAMGLQEKTALSKISTELLGPETAASLAKTYASTVGDLQKTALAGQMNLLDPGVKAQAGAMLDAAQTRNKMVADISRTNQDIAKMQENTRSQLAVQRGNFAGQIALKEHGAAMTLAGQRLFA